MKKMVKIFGSHIMTVLYPDLCNKEVCTTIGTVLYLDITISRGVRR